MLELHFLGAVHRNSLGTAAALLYRYKPDGSQKPVFQLVHSWQSDKTGEKACAQAIASLNLPAAEVSDQINRNVYMCESWHDRVIGGVTVFGVDKMVQGMIAHCDLIHIKKAEGWRNRTPQKLRICAPIVDVTDSELDRDLENWAEVTAQLIDDDRLTIPTDSSVRASVLNLLQSEEDTPKEPLAIALCMAIGQSHDSSPLGTTTEYLSRQVSVCRRLVNRLADGMTGNSRPQPPAYSRRV